MELFIHGRKIELPNIYAGYRRSCALKKLPSNRLCLGCCRLYVLVGSVDDKDVAATFYDRLIASFQEFGKCSESRRTNSGWRHGQFVSDSLNRNVPRMLF